MIQQEEPLVALNALDQQRRTELKSLKQPEEDKKIVKSVKESLLRQLQAMNAQAKLNPEAEPDAAAPKRAKTIKRRRGQGK